MTVPLVGEYGGIVPNPNTQSAEDFSVNAIDWTSYQANTLGPDINDAISQFNVDFQVVNQNSQDAQEAAEAANLSELSAASSANFKGRWSDASGAATVPSSYENNGRVWQLLQNIPDIAADEPVEGAVNWLLIDSVNMSNVRIKDLNNPTLRVFARNRLVDVISGSLSFASNSSNRTSIDLNGVLTTSGVDEPRQEKEGFLLEGGATTNLALYSEQFDNAAWSKSDVTVTPNHSTAPDLAATADKIIPTTDNSRHYVTQTAILAANSKVTLSVFVKADGYNFVSLETVNFGSWLDPARATFDLSEGTVVSGAGEIEELYDGWFLIYLAGTFGASTAVGGIRIFSQETSSDTFPGNGTDGTLAFGAQITEQAFLTSYIRTTNAQTTRLKDLASCDVRGNIPISKEGFTFSFNMFTRFASGNAILFQVETLPADFYSCTAYLAGGAVLFRIKNKAGTNFTVSSGINIENSKHQVSCGFDGTRIFMYLDGELREQIVFSGELPEIDPLGSIYFGQSSAGTFNSFSILSDFRVFLVGVNSDEARYLS